MYRFYKAFYLRENYLVPRCHSIILPLVSLILSVMVLLPNPETVASTNQIPFSWVVFLRARTE